MKHFYINLISRFIAIVCGVALLTNMAHAKDEPLPPEVKKLIGMNIPPKVVGQRGGDIPNFIRFGGGMLNRQIGDEIPKAELVFEEGLVGEKWPIFFVGASHADRTLEIMDAQLLPKKLINWRYVNGEIKWLEKEIKLIFSIFCQYRKGDGRIIFGLEDTRFEREGMSTRIERAWEIDPQSGHIKSIPTQGITCAILGE